MFSALLDRYALQRAALQSSQSDPLEALALPVTRVTARLDHTTGGQQRFVVLQQAEHPAPISIGK